MTISKRPQSGPPTVRLLQRYADRCVTNYNADIDAVYESRDIIHRAVPVSKASVYFGKAEAIITQGERIKSKTIN